ncbi:hypothetical protein O181_002098 [Austropuccinia psidii MF-1]|uniref:CHCH domain-containing protein n=1 Tax=Austropuccinia psidii MF-1 TaxID=1389203 RepID=A0A9Q3GCB0_9BASI|nr:hypothetical protein [Austropuccinia psidii MF-1]
MSSANTQAAADASVDEIHSRAYPAMPSSQDSGKTPSRLADPCQAARKASYKCLDRNNYDKSLCQDYFDVYKECQKRWLESRKKN